MKLHRNCTGEKSKGGGKLVPTSTFFLLESTCSSCRSAPVPYFLKYNGH